MDILTIFHFINTVHRETYCTDKGTIFYMIPNLIILLQIPIPNATPPLRPRPPTPSSAFPSANASPQTPVIRPPASDPRPATSPVRRRYTCLYSSINSSCSVPVSARHFCTILAGVRAGPVWGQLWRKVEGWGLEGKG